MATGLAVTAIALVLAWVGPAMSESGARTAVAQDSRFCHQNRTALMLGLIPVVCSRFGGYRLAILTLSLGTLSADTGPGRQAMIKICLCGLPFVLVRAIGVPPDVGAASKEGAGKVIGTVVDTLQSLPALGYPILRATSIRAGQILRRVRPCHDGSWMGSDRGSCSGYNRGLGGPTDRRFGSACNGPARRRLMALAPARTALACAAPTIRSALCQNPACRFECVLHDKPTPGRSDRTRSDQTAADLLPGS
jgi:hypothetical protein